MENITLGLEIQGVSKKEREQSAREYIQHFGLEGFEDHYPRELSGGMQQRVAIARTLIMNPRVVLMDEPFASLDSQTRNDLQEFLLRIWQRRGETILFVTHNVDEAVFLGDQVIVLSSRPGRIELTLPVEHPAPPGQDRSRIQCPATADIAAPQKEAEGEPKREVTAMKIIGICCSPRKGKTTCYALEQCLQAVRESAPDMETDLFELADYKFGGCLACGQCTKGLKCRSGR